MESLKFFPTLTCSDLMTCPEPCSLCLNSSSLQTKKKIILTPNLKGYFHIEDFLTQWGQEKNNRPMDRRCRMKLLNQACPEPVTIYGWSVERTSILFILLSVQYRLSPGRHVICTCTPDAGLLEKYCLQRAFPGEVNQETQELPSGFEMQGS